jgi:hypothetical protein
MGASLAAATRELHGFDEHVTRGLEREGALVEVERRLRPVLRT